MLSIEMFPAAYGDALWIEYGDPQRPHRILIDGGKLSAVSGIAERIRAVSASDPSGKCRFELAVLTHIDGDHIEGFLSLVHNMSAGALSMEVGEIWFNGAPHLPDPDQEDEPAPPGEQSASSFGALQGEMVSFVLLDSKLPWNLWSAMRPIFIPQKGPLPVRELPGGMKLTLLGPTFERLRKLRQKWDKEVAEWTKKSGGKLTPENVLALLGERPEGRIMSFGEEGIDVAALVSELGHEDDGEPNGSSIALLAEFEGQSCLFTGDAFARDMAAAVRRLLEERAVNGKAAERKLRLDVMKVAHHGSRNNISEDLLSVLDCDRFLVSTNGAIFNHPDPEAIACIVAGAERRAPEVRAARPVHIHFNYRSPETLVWAGKDTAGDSLAEKLNFHPEYPAEGKEGMRVILSETVPAEAQRDNPEAKEATVEKATGKEATVEKATGKEATVEKATGKEATVEKATGKEATVEKQAAVKTKPTAKKAAAKKKAAVKSKAPAKKPTVKKKAAVKSKAPAKKAAAKKKAAVKSKAPAKKPTVKKKAAVKSKAPAKKAPAKKAPAKKATVKKKAAVKSKATARKAAAKKLKSS